MTDQKTRGRPANKKVVALSRGIGTSKGKVKPGQVSEDLPAKEANALIEAKLAEAYNA